MARSIFWFVWYNMLMGILEQYQKIDRAAFAGRITAGEAANFRSRGGRIVISMLASIIVWCVLIAL